MPANPGVAPGERSKSTCIGPDTCLRQQTSRRHFPLLYLEIGEGGSPHAEQTSGRWYAWTRGSTYARISSDGDSVVRQACGRATLGIFMYNVQLLFTAIARLQTNRSSSPRFYNQTSGGNYHVIISYRAFANTFCGVRSWRCQPLWNSSRIGITYRILRIKCDLF